MSDGPVEWIEHKLAQVEKVVKEESRQVEGERRYPATWEDEPLSCIDDDYHHPLTGDPLTIITLAAATRQLLNLHFPNFRYVPMTKDRWIHLQGAEAVAMASRPDSVWKGDLTCDVCGEEYGLGENPRAEWPCETVKTLAKGWGWTEEGQDDG